MNRILKYSLKFEDMKEHKERNLGDYSNFFRKDLFDEDYA